LEGFNHGATAKKLPIKAVFTNSWKINNHIKIVVFGALKTDS
jgi:hypothetical protein